MKRGTVWLYVLAGLLVLSGCRSSQELSDTARLEKEICEKGQVASPSGRGKISQSNCGKGTILQKLGPNDHEPEYVDNFEGHLITDIDLPAPGEPGSHTGWFWKEYLVEAGTQVDLYWMENYKLRQSPGSREVLDEWWVPLSHLACRQIDPEVGYLACTVTLSSRVSDDQVTSQSWAVKTTLEAHTPKGVPVEARLGVELSHKFVQTLQISRNIKLSETIPLDPAVGTTGYVAVGNVWRAYATEVTFVGNLCYRDAQGKHCQPGWQADGVIQSISHAGLLGFKDRRPPGSEHGPIQGDSVPVSRGPDEVVSRPWLKEFVSTTSWKNSSMTTDEGTLYGEVNTAVGKVAVSETGGRSSGETKGTEVEYRIVLEVTPYLFERPFDLWQNKSLFYEDGTVTSRGPYFETIEGGR